MTIWLKTLSFNDCIMKIHAALLLSIYEVKKLGMDRKTMVILQPGTIHYTSVSVKMEKRFHIRIGHGKIFYYTS